MLSASFRWSSSNIITSSAVTKAASKTYQTICKLIYIQISCLHNHCASSFTITPKQILNWVKINNHNNDEKSKTETKKKKKRRKHKKHTRSAPAQVQETSTNESSTKSCWLQRQLHWSFVTPCDQKDEQTLKPSLLHNHNKRRNIWKINYKRDVSITTLWHELRQTKQTNKTG